MHDSGTRTYTSLAGAAALLSATSCGHTSAESRAKLGLQLSIAAGIVAGVQNKSTS